MAKTNILNGSTSNLLRVKILDSASTTGAGLTGLTFSSGGLIISTIAENEATATAYTAAGSTIETITTLGTFAAPTSTKCRFKEVDATNHPGVYEIQIADARYAVANAKTLIITVQVTGGVAVDTEIQFGAVPADLTKIKTYALVETAGQIAYAFQTFFNVATPTGTVNSLPNAVPGASNGLLIAGSNAPTTFSTLDVTGTLTTGGLTVGGTLSVTGATTLGGAVSLNSTLTVTGAFTASNASNDIRVDARKLGGTTQTGRDVGLSVLISSGTGTGQLDVTSGRIKADTVYFGGSAGSFTTGVPAVNTTLIAGSLVSTSTAQIGVNVVNAGGTAWGSGAITAGSIAADAITDAKVASDVTIASVTGAVGSVTGNVGGNVTGSVGSVTSGVTVTTNNDKTGYTLSSAGQQALVETYFTFNATADYAGAAAGSLVKEIADNAGGSSLTANDIADEIETRVLNAGRTIKRIAPGGGGDYTSLSAAITALSSTAGVIELVCSAGNIGGGNLHSLTSASEVILRSDLQARHRHDTAQPLSETAYFASNLVFNPTTSGPAKLRIEGLRSSGVSTGFTVTMTAPSKTYDLELIDNLFANSGGVGSSLDQIYCYVEDGTLNVLSVGNTHFTTTTGSAKGYQVYSAATADGADAARINVRTYNNTGNTDNSAKVIDGIAFAAEDVGGGTAVIYADCRNNLMLGVAQSGTSGAINIQDTGGGVTTLTGSNNATNDSSASANGLTSGLTSVVAADVLSSVTTSNIQLSTATTRDAGYSLPQETLGRRVKSGSVWDIGSHEYMAGLSATQLADIYHADIYYTRDDAGAEDVYKCVWMKNGVRITSGITSPTIRVVKEADGTDLIASTAMTEIGTTEAFKYTATTTARQTAGESCLVVVGATIDGSARTFIRSLGRDSTA